MLDLRLTDLSIYEFMKEQISIRRADQDENYDPDDASTYTTIVSNVDSVFTEPQSPQTILPTGQVINEPDFRCRLEPPATRPENGDIVIREDDGSTLYVESVSHPKNTHIMTLGLQRQQ